jgi:hypothetical protein
MAELDLNERLQRAEGAVPREKFALQQAQTKLKVLDEYTRVRTLKELGSEVERARSGELARQDTWNLEMAKEKKLRTQIENCTIKARDDGIVVYANDPFHPAGTRLAGPVIEQGAMVRERQKIFSIYDPRSPMRVNVKVPESMVNSITPGLRARIKVDSFPDETLLGVVKVIAPLPDRSSFFSSGVKVYTTHVSIEKRLPDLRPGMSSQVDILVIELPNVLSVPVQAVLQFKNKDHIAVKTADGYDWREVTLGISNDKLVEVKKGVNSGELVALSPLALMSEEQKREAFGSTDEVSKKDFGANAPAKIGQAPVPPGAAGEAGKDLAKGKGQGGRIPPALLEKFKAIPAEEKAKIKGARPEEREAILRKAGFTDDEVRQLNRLGQQPVAPR